MLPNVKLVLAAKHAEILDAAFFLFEPSIYPSRNTPTTLFPVWDIKRSIPTKNPTFNVLAMSIQ